MIKTNPYCVINALKIGDRVEDILRNSDYKLMVHSVFEHAVNLIDKSDWIITLLPESYSGGPQAIILAEKDFAGFKAFGLKAKDACDFSKLIDIKDAQITYRKITNEAPKDPIKIEANKEYFYSILSQKGNKNGLLGKDNIYSKYAAPIMEEFHTFFQKQKFEEAGDGLVKLIGLGPGLTPSGDDFVLGIFAAFYSLGVNKSIIFKLKDIIIEKAINKTNLISYNMLRQGAMGGFIEWVEDMALSLIYGDFERIDNAFSHMQKIGSSSGSDISAGILFGMSIWNNKEVK